MIEVCAIHITYLQAFAICTITNKNSNKLMMIITPV